MNIEDNDNIVGSLPTNRIERLAVISAQLFHPDFEGVEITKRIKQLSKDINLSTTALWNTYVNNNWKERYQREMGIYQKKKEEEAKDNTYAKVIYQNDGRTADNISATLTSASAYGNKYITYKLAKQNFYLSEISQMLEVRGGFGGLTVDEKLKLKLMEQELDRDFNNLKALVVPEKLSYYMEAMIAYTALGSDGEKDPLKKGFTFMQLIQLALADETFKKPDSATLTANVISDFKIEDLPDISGRITTVEDESNMTNK